MSATRKGTPAKRPSLYQRVTDWISFAQGTPANLGFWLVAVGLWFALAPEIAKSSFLPGWASSPNWNFPINTGTSILELFIGYLVSASTNRSERNLELILRHISDEADASLADETEALVILRELSEQVTSLGNRVAGDTIDEPPTS